ncbi:MAG: CooT family nickel-binding protein [Methanothrix sp.]
MSKTIFEAIKMCELKVYMKGDEKILMEGVVALSTRGEKILMEDIIGRTKEAKGRIVEVSISAQRAILEPV